MEKNVVVHTNHYRRTLFSAVFSNPVFFDSQKPHPGPDPRQIRERRSVDMAPTEKADDEEEFAAKTCENEACEVHRRGGTANKAHNTLILILTFKLTNPNLNPKSDPDPDPDPL